MKNRSITRRTRCLLSHCFVPTNLLLFVCLRSIEPDNEQLAFVHSWTRTTSPHPMTMVTTSKLVPTPSDTTLLLPRRYQEEIFRRSQEENIIAALDTGSGKTFISTLLIKWMSLQEFAQGKVILFLVPKVALVEQQAEFIATQTPLRVTKLRGAVEMDLTDRDKWRAAFTAADVLVMTGASSVIAVALMN